MSHSSGIPVAKELEQAFGAARSDASIRYVLAEIRDERVVQVGKGQPSGSLKGDVDHIRSLLQPGKPCYVLLKLDSKNDGGFEWMLISYVPDGSPVKERMLYASTRDTVKKSLGSSSFAEDLFASSPGDVSYDACQEVVSKKHYEGPLTQTEIMTRIERSAVIDTGATKEYVHSVAFPLSDEGKAALDKFAKHQLKLVQLKVDTTKETLELATTKAEATAATLGGEISASEPRFTFFSFPHTFNEENFNTILFIYSCPNEAPVKQKMLYSTVKAVAVGCAEEKGVKIDKKLEVTDASEVADHYLLDEIHFKTEETKKGFARPARPGKGGPRLVKK